MSIVTVNIADLRLFAGETCDNCGADLDIAGAIFCDDCRDNAALDIAARDYVRGGESLGDAGDIFDPLETDTLTDTLQDICSGLSTVCWGES